MNKQIEHIRKDDEELSLKKKDSRMENGGEATEEVDSLKKELEDFIEQNESRGEALKRVLSEIIARETHFKEQSENQ